MAIKGGDLIHVADQILIDRAQTAGPGDVTINSEKIFELGNYLSLASVYDTPDLSFSLESFDASAEFEAALLRKTFDVKNGTQTFSITGSPTGGTFTITFSGQTTTALAYNATPAAVQTALEALSNVAVGEATVTGYAGSVYTVVFSGATVTGASVPVATASATGLTGGTTPGVTIVGSRGGVALPDGTALKPAAALPVDVAAAFKPGQNAANAYNVVGSVAIPFLTLESLSYKFGISENASQSATLRGDSMFYSKSATYIDEFAGTNTAGQTVTLTHPAIVYKGDTTNGTRYALSVSTSTGTRLSYGADFTEAATGAGPGYAVTLTITDAIATTDTIRVIYASTDTATYPQLSHAAVSAVRPAAIRGRNIEVFIGGRAVSDKWTSVQSVNVDWRVTLEKDEELGNAQAVSQSFDVPEVSGSVEVKPRDFEDLYTKICEVAGVTLGEVAGPLTTRPLSLIVVLHSPDTGAVLKTIEVPDARFTLPGYSGQAGQGQKLTVTFNWTSDTGDMTVWKGAKP